MPHNLGMAYRTTLMRMALVVLVLGTAVSCSTQSQRDESEPQVTIERDEDDKPQTPAEEPADDVAGPGLQEPATPPGARPKRDPSPGPNDSDTPGAGVAAQPPAATPEPAPQRALADARQVQAQVMDFADELTLRLAETLDAIESGSQSVEARTIAHRLKYTVAHGATIIAAAQNPRIALVDMYVMIKIQRDLLERNIVPKHFPNEGQRLKEVFGTSEREIRRLAERALTPENLATIDEIIAKWLKENPDRVYAGYVRLAEFSAARQVTALQTGQGRSGNVLGFLALDPLAGLDPTTREIEQARLLAERAFFYMQRMPTLISWQAELLVMDTVSEPESRRVLASVQSLTASVEQITRDVNELNERFPTLISEERQAILESLNTTIDEQRERAIDQTLAGLSDERKALIDQLSEQEEQLRPLITDLRQTVDSTTALSESVRGTTAQFEQLAKLLNLDEPKDPDAEPTSIKDVTEALRETTRAVEELVKLSESIKGTTDPVVLEERLQMIEQRLVNAEQSANRIMDRAFRLALTLVIVLVVGLLVVVVVGVWLRGRKGKPAA